VSGLAQNAFEKDEELKTTPRQQFVTSAGFGNCVVVSQGAAAGGAKKAVVRHLFSCEEFTDHSRITQGSRAARSSLAEIEARGGETAEVVKRGITSWIWA
jgi:hypothetical protein